MNRRALLPLCLLLLGCGGVQIPTPSTPVVPEFPSVTVSYLERLYAIDNETYFRNRLPKHPSIDLTEDKNMASTLCNDGDCVLKFNLKYVAAERVANFTMLHEMCHVMVWGKELDDDGKEIVHGKIWRSCMLQLDAVGAFREIIIDGYREGN